MELKKYNIYRNWGLELFETTDDEREAWKALGKLNFGEGYFVKDAHGNVIPDFVPF